MVLFSLTVEVDRVIVVEGDLQATVYPGEKFFHVTGLDFSRVVAMIVPEVGEDLRKAIIDIGSRPVSLFLSNSDRSNAPRPYERNDGLRASLSAVRKVFENTRGSKRSKGLRDALLVHLIVETRSTAKEIADFNLADFSPSNQAMLMRDGSSVTLSEETLVLISEWLMLRGSEPGPFVCPLKRNGKMTNRRLSQQGVSQSVEAISREAGISGGGLRDWQERIRILTRIPTQAHESASVTSKMVVNLILQRAYAPDSLPDGGEVIQLKQP